MTKGGLGREPQAAPSREGAGGPRRDPPPVLASPSTGPQATGAPAPTPPEAEGMIPPPPGRTAAPEWEAGAGPAPTPQPPDPAGTTKNKRTRANTPGRHTDRARGQQASTNRNAMPLTRIEPYRPPRPTIRELMEGRPAGEDNGEVPPKGYLGRPPKSAYRSEDRAEALRRVKAREIQPWRGDDQRRAHGAGEQQ